MLKSRLHSSLLLLSGVSGIVLASTACSSGGTDPVTIVQLPTAGTGSTDGGSASGGSGVIPTAGSTTTAGTASGGQAGSASTAGSGTGGATGGTGDTGGMGGATGGSGGAAGGSGGAAGGSGGGSNSFCGTEAGKVVLFDGTDATFKNWYQRYGGVNSTNPWTNNGDGTMTVKNGGGDIVSKTAFQNVCLHIEYQAPKYTYPQDIDPQQRGNSGVYLKGSWEMQVLDTFDLGKTQNDFCGAIYKVSAPLVSACKTGGEWNAYDIEFQGNVCTDGQTTTPAKFIKVNLNGINVQNNVVVPVTETQAGMMPTCDPRGVLLQDHVTKVPVSFRNIWAIPRP